MRWHPNFLSRMLIWIGGACLLYALLGLILGWEDFRSGLAAFPLWALGPLAGLSLFNYGLRFLRWQYYVESLGVSLPRGDSARIFFATFAMVMTPGKLGEVYKAVHLRERHDVPLSTGLTLLVAERLFDFLGVLLLAGIAAFAWRGPMAGPWLEGGALVVLAAVLLAMRAGKLQRALIGRIAAAPYLRRHRVGVHDTLDRLGLLLSGRVAAVSLALSAVAWASECASLWLVCIIMDLPVDPLSATFIYATATLAGSLAFLPGGLGGTEATLIFLLMSRDVPRGLAVSASVIVRLMTLWLAVGLGVGVFAAARRRLLGESATGISGMDSVLKPVDDQHD